MINIKNEGIILWKTEREFENSGVLNPAVIKQGEIVHLFTGQYKKEIIQTLVTPAHCVRLRCIVINELMIAGDSTCNGAENMIYITTRYDPCHFIQ